MLKADLVKERISAAIDRMGQYQIWLILLMSTNNLIVGINHTLTSFLTYTPKFYCESVPNEVSRRRAGRLVVERGGTGLGLY